MKFTAAWAQISAQNVTLRAVIACLSLTSISLAVGCLRISLKEPLIIERGCFSKAIERGNTRRTKEEINAFVEEALKARFDSATDSPSNYLSAEETEFRRQEQDSYKSNNITQKIIVNSATEDQGSPKQENGTVLAVDADRILSVGKVRSVLAFPLLMTIASTSRSSSNPYGLVLVRVTAANKDKETEAPK